jgi:hypothetical protein
MRCPQCDISMNEVTARANPGSLIQLDQCAQCGGIWCDKWELFPIDPDQASRLDFVDEKLLSTLLKLQRRPCIARAARASWPFSMIRSCPRIFCCSAAADVKGFGSIAGN